MSHFFHQRVMKGDGACFFRAMAAALWDNQEMHLIVRATAIAYMKENPERFAPYLVHPYELYVADMRLPTTWADNHIIQAIADKFDIAIVVTRPSGEPTYTVTPVRFERGIDAVRKVARTVHVEYDDVHYNYLLPDAELRQQDARHACRAHERQMQNHAQALLDVQYAHQLHEQFATEQLLEEARPWSSWWDVFAWR